MIQATTRSIFRWIHIIFAIPIAGYIYSPFDKIPIYAVPTRFVFVPVLVLSGLWMWKGHLVRRLFFRRDRLNNVLQIIASWKERPKEFEVKLHIAPRSS
jgi:hypothetical protein